MRNYLKWSFDIMSSIFLAGGIIFVIVSIALESLDSLIAGVLMILSHFYTKGFGCIVEAAFVYLEKNGISDRKQEKEEDRTVESR